MLVFRKMIKAILPLVFLCLCGQITQAQRLIKPPFIQPEWSQDYKPFRIAGNLYYVGTADLACYLITTPKGSILINTGLPDSGPMIKKHIEDLGFKFSDIKLLLATHAHYDHVGALASIKGQTGAKVMIHKKDAQALADGGNSDYVMGGKGPTFLPVKADKELCDNDTIKFYGMRIRTIHCPGHTPGACSFLFDVKDDKRTYKVLIANMPTVLSETKLSGMPGYKDVGEDYEYTLRKMKGIKFDIWLASHASQFNLQKKHKPDDAYNPEEFFDQKGYDAALDALQKDYLKKLNGR